VKADASTAALLAALTEADSLNVLADNILPASIVTQEWLHIEGRVPEYEEPGEGKEDTHPLRFSIAPPKNMGRAIPHVPSLARTPSLMMLKPSPTMLSLSSKPGNIDANDRITVKHFPMTIGAHFHFRAEMSSHAKVVYALRSVGAVTVEENRALRNYLGAQGFASSQVEKLGRSFGASSENLGASSKSLRASPKNPLEASRDVGKA